MKDYYNLWFMSRHFEFEGSTLTAAVRATFERREGGDSRAVSDWIDLEYAADLNHVRQWAAFTESLRIEASPYLEVVIDKISEFVFQLAIAAATEQPFNQQWKPQNRWQPGR